MSNNNLDDKPKSNQSLAREEILNNEEPVSNVTLPSGKIIKVKYLSLNMVVDIMKSVEDLPEDQKPQLFTEMAVKYFLRENVQSKLSIFSEEDQKFLIEEAVRQWGCEDEYIEFSEIVSPTERFYKAATEQEQKYKSQLLESMGSITSIMASEKLMDVSWFESYQRSMQSLVTPLEKSLETINAINKFAGTIDFTILDEYASIGKMMDPISKLFEADVWKTNLSYADLLLESTNDAFDSFRKLMEPIASIEAFSQLPEVVRYYPSVEMYNTSVLLGQLENKSEFRDKELVVPEDGSISIWLNNLDSSFLTMLQGAEKTIYSDNPEKSRHFSISHRELFTHLLNHLAPDDQIRGWTSDPNMFHNGNPTRKARLIFIARDYRQASFVDFFIKDGLNQIDLLNADSHRKAHSYGEQELSILHNRFLSWLEFLKRIVGR